MTRRTPTLAAMCLVLLGCGGGEVADAGLDASIPDAGLEDAGARDAGLPVDAPACTEGARTCEGALRVTCEGGEVQVQDCAAEGRLCHPEDGCIECIPDEPFCLGGHVAHCDERSMWVAERCDFSEGRGCVDGTCVDLCDEAARRPSARGCEFFAVQLDNAEVEMRPRRPSGLVIVNPWPGNAEVTVERNDAAVGAAPVVAEVSRHVIPGEDYEVVTLPWRPVDREDLDAAPTHSALTSHAFRVRSDLPVLVFQQTPLDPGSSADGSRLLPTAALGTRTTVNGWPQTIAHGETPGTDYDRSRDDEDLRTFLTVVGTEAETHVRIELGDLGPNNPAVVAGGPIPELGPYGTFETDLGPFDVLNLETRGLNTDFTGSRVIADAPVAVFVGSEASDAPPFERYSERSCCADHLEEQLPPDERAGSRFVVGRSPPRSQAVARAVGDEDTRAVYAEPEWVRVLAVSEAVTVTTTLEDDPGPFELAAGQDVILRADESFELTTADADQHVTVQTVLPSLYATGLAFGDPGGDPSTALLVPERDWVASHDVAVPPEHLFDFIVVTSPADASVRLDGVLTEELSGPDGEPACTVETIGEHAVHACQVSFPEYGLTELAPGTQGDGHHRVRASAPVGVVVSGFGRFSSYAFPGELAPREAP